MTGDKGESMKSDLAERGRKYMINLALRKFVLDGYCI